MPTGEDYFYRPVVTVDGTVLPEQVAALITEVYLDDSVHLPSLLVLRLSDPADTATADGRIRIGATIALAVGSSSPGTPAPLVEARVTSLERQIDSRGSYTVVRALDARRALQGGPRVATYVDRKVSDVVATIAQRAGLTCEVDSIGPVYPQLTQDAVSDWDFITALATRHHAVLSMKGSTLQFRKPPRAASAPATAGSPLVIETGDQVLSLRATISDSGQVPEVQARGWSPKQKKAVAATARAATTSATVSGHTPAALGKPYAPELVSTPELTEVTQVEQVAQAQMGSRSGAFAELEARLRGNAALHAGAAITLKGAGKDFDGKYVLTAVRHTFDELAGYITDVTVADASDRSSYGVLIGGAEPTPAHRSVLPALVTNVKDPDNTGRVKVSFPTLSDQEESWWARVVQAGAGAKRGTVLLPEVGDEVLVAFAGTGVAAPYVLGGVYNGKDLPDPGFAQHVNGNGQVIRRAFTSRTGMSVEVLEDTGETKLNIRSQNGKERVTITQSPAGGIEIVSDGAITVTAKQSLKLSGQEVEIAAHGALKLSGLNVNVAAQANAAIKANGQAELSSTGPVTVRGALVKIN